MNWITSLKEASNLIYIFCLQVDGPVNGGRGVKEEELISGSLRYAEEKNKSNKLSLGNTGNKLYMHLSVYK